jgi:hypothetical protein
VQYEAYIDSEKTSALVQLKLRDNNSFKATINRASDLIRTFLAGFRSLQFGNVLHLSRDRFSEAFCDRFSKAHASRECPTSFSLCLCQKIVIYNLSPLTHFQRRSFPLGGGFSRKSRKRSEED